MKTKKQNLAVLAAFAMTLGLIAPALLVAPAMADTEIVGTTAVVSTGGGAAPVIKAKWEQDNTASLEDGDLSHATPGSQFLPPCIYQDKKPVEYCAVVTDEEERGDVPIVSVDVSHPRETWECGSFKYQLLLTKETNKAVAEAKLKNAYAAGLVTFNSGFDLDEVVHEIQQDLARLWCGNGELDYEQPAGMYTVEATAYDQNSNKATPLRNQFQYVPVTCFEVDNDAVDYGPIQISTAKIIGGDKIFQRNDDNKMTVRNLGNTNMQVTVLQDDMGFGASGVPPDTIWNVEYDGRLGYLVDTIFYDPFVLTTLPGLLPHSTDEKIDFSIHLKKGSGGHRGQMTLGSVIADNGCRTG